MSSFVSAVIARSALRAPRVEVTLEPLQRVGQQHARGRDEEEAGEDLRALERRSCDGHHSSDPVLSRHELADDDADESVSDTETQAGEDERDGSRQRDGLEDDEIACAERPGDLDEMR